MDRVFPVRSSTRMTLVLSATQTAGAGGDVAERRLRRAVGDESTVVRLHSGHGPHQEMDERAIACFDHALEDAALTEERLRHVLHDYFAWATTTTMSAYHDSADDVPEGLSIPHWSWDGLLPTRHPLR
jgi:hypothetical protein